MQAIQKPSVLSAFD